MTDLTAIDILVNPDDETIAKAKVVNQRLRKSLSGGYALDASHQPHITTLQRYVKTTELDRVFDSVERTIADTDISSLVYQAQAIRHTAWGVPGQGYCVFLVEPAPRVLDFQALLLANVTPFVGSDGTSDAFVTDEDDPDINETTLKWVEQFVPDQIGSKYIPHISLGFATLDDLKVIEAEPFDPFPIHPTSIAVYQLGNNGNARKELHSCGM
jgi:hypothetical protein